MSVIYFKNLYVPDIEALYLSLVAGRANTKLKSNIKKMTRGDSIDCRDL